LYRIVLYHIVARFFVTCHTFLWWNRGVFYSVQETGTRKNWYQIDWHTTTTTTTSSQGAGQASMPLRRKNL